MRSKILVDFEYMNIFQSGRQDKNPISSFLISELVDLTQLKMANRAPSAQCRNMIFDETWVWVVVIRQVVQHIDDKGVMI